ncbi:UNVERIFIED_CONTAM: cytochrome d ubiquinol oxidase subunit II [Brevibacillus sp. OAP136]
MELHEIGVIIAWVFLYGYLIVASIDFGAGFFSFYAKLTRRDHIINKIIERYLSPVWEVTNVFLIFFVYAVISFFPDVAYVYGVALLVPGSIALVLLCIRGSFYAFANYGARKNIYYLFAYGVSGLFIPASLATLMTVSEGGFISVQGRNVELLIGALVRSPYSWVVVFLALTSVLFISASFLSYYADRAKDVDAGDLLRKFALYNSLPTIFFSFFAFFTLRNHNPEHFERMLDMSWMFIASLGCFLVALALYIQRKWYGTAFIFVMLQFAFAFFGYGRSHLPYLLYPYLTIESGVTSEAMGAALIAAFIGGLLLLIPSLYLLMRLFIFNADYVQRGKGS